MSEGKRLTCVLLLVSLCQHPFAQPTGRNRLSSPFPDFQDCQWLTIIAASPQWVLFNKSSCETKKDSGEQRAFAEEVHALVRHGWLSKFNALARATR